MGWTELALFGVAGASGNLGFMMATGFIPGPPGMEYALGMTLALLSAQALLVLANIDALLPGRARDVEDVEEDVA